MTKQASTSAKNGKLPDKKGKKVYQKVHANVVIYLYIACKHNNIPGIYAQTTKCNDFSLGH